MASLMPLFAQAQAHISEMSSYQIDQILNHCKKVVLHTTLEREDGVNLNILQEEPEEFTVIFDYPHGGCDFYIRGQKHAYALSRPMNAKKEYLDKNTKPVQPIGAYCLMYRFHDSPNNDLCFGLLRTDGKITAALVYYVNGKYYRNHKINTVDFYDTSDRLIAKGYEPSRAADINDLNLFRCYLDNAYNRYK